jgi:hypothetical protein
LTVPFPSHPAITTYRLALASAACGIVALGLGLVPIESHKHSGFFALGFMPAFAAILTGVVLLQEDDEKRISWIGRCIFGLGILGAMAVAWASGYQYNGG